MSIFTLYVISLVSNDIRNSINSGLILWIQFTRNIVQECFLLSKAIRCNVCHQNINLNNKVYCCFTPRSKMYYTVVIFIQWLQSVGLCSRPELTVFEQRTILITYNYLRHGNSIFSSLIGWSDPIKSPFTATKM